LSKRQLLATTWWNRPSLKTADGIICDGAVRSGKTVSMVDGFLLWATATFDGHTFAICGKTIESLRRNVVLNLHDWLGGVLTIKEKRQENKLIVSDGRHTNTVFLFGGRDESSYMLIQGITLAGVLLDEVALMPRSFVEQALARCSVDGSKFWFNCNPAGPMHWFFTDYVQEARAKNLLHLHFTMADNPALTPAIRRRYETMYAGVFYRRYVQGEWCLAEGLIYQFDADRHTTDEVPGPLDGEWFVSCDYGTLNPFSAGLWCLKPDGRAVRVREYYYSGRTSQANKTDEEYHAALVDLTAGLPIRAVIVDPSAASFIETVRRHGLFSVRKAKNDVLDGIRLTAALLAAGRIKINPACRDSIREFGLYSWDEKSGSDRPVKENDHAMDDIRYFCSTVMRPLLRYMPDMRGLTQDDESAKVDR